MKKASTNRLKVGICRKNSIFHHFVEVCRSLYNTFLLVKLLIINIVESVEVVEAILLPNQMPSLITIGHKKKGCFRFTASTPSTMICYID